MNYYQRRLKLLELLGKKSHFLFGARSTGKSTIIKHQLADARLYDLLSASTYQRFLRHPEALREELKGYNGIVVIDEIQKLPKLLDEVHWLIENRRNKFLLTGSSSRKLKHGGANLLAGRAWLAELFPLTSDEITDFNLIHYVNRGGLPQIYQSDDYQKELENYVDLYIREEVNAEALTRNVDAFVEFLDLLALSNGEEINFSSFASDCGISTTAIKSYFSILEDTHLGFYVPAFVKTKKRKAITRAKFYFFDIGITNYLANRGEIKEGSEAFGRALEHFVAMELRAALTYSATRSKLQYWRTTSQIEVDFIIANCAAIEVKSSKLVQNKHMKGLRALREESEKLPRYIVVSLDSHRRKTEDGIEIFPIDDFLREIWEGRLF